MNPAIVTLPHLGLLRFKGADAVSFLQGQVSNDTRRLTEGKPVLAACSTPQGRVFAILRLIPHSAGVLAILPREILADTHDRLRRYIMRSKVRIEAPGESWAIAGIEGHDALVAAGLAVPGPATGYMETGGIGVACADASGARFLVVGPTEQLAATGLPGLTENAWKLADIRAGMPQVYAATQELFVAQMLNLDLVDGISFTKGCFTGQEIIARTQHLGRIKRRMFRLRPPAGPLRPGDPVTLGEAQGRITEWAEAPEGAEALAVLGEDAGGATLLPLPYSPVATASGTSG